MYHIKRTSVQEYRMHRLIHNAIGAEFKVPRAYKYVEGEMWMQRIHGISLSDMYGEEWSQIPTNYRAKIRTIIQYLFLKGYVYPDVTGYNFIEADGDVWIVDFGHAFVYTPTMKMTPQQQSGYLFVLQFINGECGWNNEYK
jgi:tRNA A-37 threonylcarbamoyl transferase component Bud32